MASKARVIMAFYGAKYVGKWDKNLRLNARGARSKGYKTVSIAQCTVVELSTTSAFLIIFHIFQIQTFKVLQQSFGYKKIFFKQ